MLVPAPSGSPRQGASPAGRGAVLQDQGTQPQMRLRCAAQTPQRLRPNQRMELPAPCLSGSVMLCASEPAVTPRCPMRRPVRRRSSFALR